MKKKNIGKVVLTGAILSAVVAGGIVGKTTDPAIRMVNAQSKIEATQNFTQDAQFRQNHQSYNEQSYLNNDVKYKQNTNANPNTNNTSNNSNTSNTNTNNNYNSNYNGNYSGNYTGNTNANSNTNTNNTNTTYENTKWTKWDTQGSQSPIDSSMTVTDYQDKIDKLNQKYAHMFKLKREMESYEQKQTAYYALQACYQQELKDICHDWAGVTPRDFWGMPQFRLGRNNRRADTMTDSTKKTNKMTTQQVQSTQNQNTAPNQNTVNTQFNNSQNTANTNNKFNNTNGYTEMQKNAQGITTNNSKSNYITRTNNTQNTSNNGYTTPTTLPAKIG